MNHSRRVGPQGLDADVAATECELLWRVAAADESAFRRLHEMTVGRFLRVAMGIVRDRAIAEDAVQETYLTIWRRASSFDPARARASVWMLLILRGKAIDLLRRRGVRRAAIERLADSGLVPTHGEAPATGDSALDSALDPAMGGRAREAVAALPPEQREALLLAFQGGMSGSEIAEYRQIPLGTVKTRIRQGLIRLREAMGQRSDHP